jgi:ZipA-like protein with FtsZ-binding domain
MSDLQLGLLVIGAVAVAGVLVYNRVQERAVRRDAQRAFASPHADALLDPVVRVEKRAPASALPDSRVDYVIVLKAPLTPASMLQAWPAIEQRFAHRARLTFEGSEWRAALQLVSRSGVVGEAELLEFRSEVETLAARLGASVSAPEMRQALEAAHQLDRACADADIQVAFHVLGIPQKDVPGEHPFRVTRRADGLTLVLDVPRTAELARSYEAMVRTGRGLAAAHAGRLVDDNGNELDERALAAIGAELDAVRQRLMTLGIEPGSPLALRVFS